MQAIKTSTMLTLHFKGHPSEQYWSFPMERLLGILFLKFYYMDTLNTSYAHRVFLPPCLVNKAVKEGHFD